MHGDGERRVRAQHRECVWRPGASPPSSAASDPGRRRQTARRSAAPARRSWPGGGAATSVENGGVAGLLQSHHQVDPELARDEVVGEACQQRVGRAHPGGGGGEVFAERPRARASRSCRRRRAPARSPPRAWRSGWSRRRPGARRGSRARRRRPSCSRAGAPPPAWGIPRSRVHPVLVGPEPACRSRSRRVCRCRTSPGYRRRRRTPCRPRRRGSPASPRRRAQATSAAEIAAAIW